MKTNLSECVKILDSKRIPISASDREKLAKNYPYYGAQGIIDYVDSYIFDGDFILVAEDGNNLRTLMENIATWATGKFWVNNHAHILGSKVGYSLKYIYYLLNSLDLRGYITGSAQPKFTQENLARVELNLPDYTTQCIVAETLSEIDEKLSLNDSICSELESMAKMLYDYWFVQFDFPDENGKPYKSSGGKMVWNETLKRPIPDGWNVMNLSDIAYYNTDKIDASFLTNENYIGTDNLLSDMNGRTTSEYTPTKGFVNKFIPGDILLSNIRPYFKKLWLSDIEGGCSADVLVLRAIDDTKSIFIYQTLARDNFFIYDMSGAKGSKMPRGDKDHIMNYSFAYSTSHTDLFCKIIKSWRKKISTLYYENQQLASLRDFLLPMLMNGQVKIKP